MHDQRQIHVEFDQEFTPNSALAKMVVKMQAQIGRMEARLAELERLRRPIVLQRPSAPLH